MRQLQQFFETHLSEVWPWHRTELRTAEKQEKKIGVRQLDKELAVVDFGGYALSIQSPDDHPPLGRVQMFDTRNGHKIEGIVDEATWALIGEYIRNNPPDRLKEPSHVYG